MDSDNTGNICSYCGKQITDELNIIVEKKENDLSVQEKKCIYCALPVEILTYIIQDKGKEWLVQNNSDFLSLIDDLMINYKNKADLFKKIIETGIFNRIVNEIHTSDDYYKLNILKKILYVSHSVKESSANEGINSFGIALDFKDANISIESSDINEENDNDGDIENEVEENAESNENEDNYINYNGFEDYNIDDDDTEDSKLFSSKNLNILLFLSALIAVPLLTFIIVIVVNYSGYTEEIPAKFTGHKTETYSFGIYSGDYVDDLFHGKGKITWNDSSWYDGDWEYGTLTGKGEHHGFMSDTEEPFVYTGDFVNGVWHGKGTLRVRDSVLEGEFINGQANGEMTWIDSDSDIRYIHYENGVIID